MITKLTQMTNIWGKTKISAVGQHDRLNEKREQETCCN